MNKTLTEKQNSVLKQLSKRAMERILEAEIEHHLAYRKGESSKFVAWKDRKAVAPDLGKIYAAATIGKTEQAFSGPCPISRATSRIKTTLLSKFPCCLILLVKKIKKTLDKQMFAMIIFFATQPYGLSKP